MNRTEEEKLNDQRISYHESKKGGWLHRLVRRLTRWAWKAHVRAPINRMHERGLINSRAYHEAHDFATRIIYETPPPVAPPNDLAHTQKGRERGPKNTQD